MVGLSTRQTLISGSRVNALGTLASRVLGMLRDMATAALLGVSGGGVMDAFVLAFRLPNLVRRLFGEGALAASYLPVFSAEWERDRRAAWQLFSVLLVRLAAILVVLVAGGECLLAVLGLFGGDWPGVRLFASLAAVMLPYALLICLAAQTTATLHALGHFAVPALVPAILNICWLIGALVVAPRVGPDKPSQAMVLAACVLVAGLFQLGVQIPVLRAKGARFDYAPQAARRQLGQIARSMGPMVLGLMITQINTLADSLIAWLLSAPAGARQSIEWLGGMVQYPMQQGAVAALYYGERLYQFPLGVLGLAVATAIFPLLSRHAARHQFQRLGDDLTLGLRLVLCLGVPAGVGLIMLAQPLARLLFERREFTPHDTIRTARLIACYAGGVWAYCALPVLVRGYYATGDRRTPVTVGAATVGLNLALNLTLVWPLAEAGLAVATAAGATVQVVALAVMFSPRRGPLGWSALAATAARTVAATLLMAVAGCAVLWSIPPAGGLAGKMVRVALPVLASVGVYATAYRLFGGRELGILLGGGPRR